MKKALILTLMALGLAACADTRSHIDSEATTWEKVEYQTEEQQQQ